MKTYLLQGSVHQEQNYTWDLTIQSKTQLHQQSDRTQPAVHSECLYKSVSRTTSFLSPRVLLRQYLSIQQIVFTVSTFSIWNCTRKHITFLGIIGRISLNLPGPTTPKFTWGFTTASWSWRYRTSPI